ncbi:MAG: hypothetical protein AB4426_14380 [Xenococcaceae cyanobacterium]
MSNNRRDKILKQFVDNTKGVQYAVLFSDEGEPINDPIGEWDEESAVDILVGMFEQRNLARQRWSEIEKIWLEAKDGYLIGVPCSPTNFLLVKADKTGLLGQLRRVINKTVEALQAELNAEETLDLDKKEVSVSKETEVSVSKENSASKPKNEVFPETNKGIVYRGQRIS